MYKKILLIEDEERHKKDALDYFTTLSGVEIISFCSWKQLQSFLSHVTPFSPEICATSDAYIPLHEGSSHKLPLCILVVETLFFTMGIPTVVVSSMFHHNEDIQWICDWLTLRKLPYVVDSGSLSQCADQGRTEHKNWKRAWELLQTYPFKIPFAVPAPCKL